MGELCLESGQSILFIGDSITDCGRRDSAAPLGNGYVRLFSELVMAYYPERDLRYINAGIGGNRITDLRDRWEEDALAHKPDWLSIKIGINDLHSYLRGDPGGVSPELYAEIYDQLLHETAKGLDCPIVLMVPSRPPAIPSDLFGTELIIALIFGVEKREVPKPIMDNEIAIRKTG